MKKYDLLVIGMGPAGMAVSAMGSAMGLSVLAIEKDKVGGECLNCGCIPSKALLKAGEALNTLQDLAGYGIQMDGKPADASAFSGDPLGRVREKLAGIKNKKFMKAFEKTHLIQGEAEFTGKRSVRVNGEEYTAKHIYIATGTAPFIPPIPGLAEIPGLLTNVNLFDLEEIPESMTIIGGGAIGCEMAQAFSRLGCTVSIVHIDSHLVPIADAAGAAELEKALKNDGVAVYNGCKIEQVRHDEQSGQIVLTARPLEGGNCPDMEDAAGDAGSAGSIQLRSQKVLVAAGRQPVLEPLRLDKAGIRSTAAGITVNKYMRTNRRRIYAVGDCNGHSLFSHAAMHQGMLALMRAVSPVPMRMFQRKRYFVPWSVFTQPEIAQVGLTEEQAREKGIKFEIIQKDYKSYGRTVADGHPDGFIKVITNRFGRIFGVTIVGEAASELIHEWVFAMQYKKSMFSIMMMQHSFPSISMINKMVCEDWMMKRMNSRFLRALIRFFV